MIEADALEESHFAVTNQLMQDSRMMEAASRSIIHIIVNKWRCSDLLRPGVDLSVASTFRWIC